MSKKTSQINVAVTPELAQRAERIERKTGIKPTEMGRVGLVEVLNRLEGGMPLMMTISGEDLRLYAEVISLGGNPADILRAAIPTLSPRPPTA